jgi:hypothetical protein
MTMAGTILRSGVVRATFAVAVVLFCAAPTPGDIGGCGQRVQPLDPQAFYERKKSTDCEKCRECEFTTDFCKDACDKDMAPPTEFPEGCDPIVHDGEVCLNALDAASCGDYETYVKDKGREAPNECRFCPPEAQ